MAIDVGSLEGVTFEATSADTSKATVTVVGNEVRITRVGDGKTTISIIAKKAGYNPKTITVYIDVKWTPDMLNINMVPIPNKDFAMADTEITQKQWQAIMGNNPSNFNGSSGKEAASGETQENRPVENVSWYDTLVFCNKLSMKEGRTPCYKINGTTNPAEWGDVPTSSNDAWDNAIYDSNASGYRLPTEAEWKYAAKGGENDPAYAGVGSLGDVAWYKGNSGDKTHEVKKKPVNGNGYGLYDMSGNVWEFCWDKPTNNSLRVYMGGGYGYNEDVCRLNPSGSITYPEPSRRSYATGFRVVCG